MSRKLYEEYFTPEQFKNMKASDIRDLKKKEQSATVMITMFCGAIFLELITLVATVLWTSKFTIFMLIVGLLFIGLFSWLARFSLKQFKKKVESCKEELQ